MDLEHELNIAKNLAKEASKIALDYRFHHKVWQKAHGEGPVSSADKKIDTLICQGLKKEFASDLIISEESFNEKDLLYLKHAQRVWFIDPIDGTSSYILGKDDFVVMIGLFIDAVARLGVIFQPVTNTMWLGIYDPIHENNFCQKIVDKEVTTIKIDSKSVSLSDIRLVLSSSYKGKKQEQLIEKLKTKNIIKSSSVGLKAMLILEQKADLYVSWAKDIKLWDTCAPEAIMRAANGFMAYIDQSPLNYNGFIGHKKHIFAANFMPDKNLIELLKNISKSNS